MNFIEDSNGKFGRFGGCFAPELLQPVLSRVTAVFEKFKSSPELQEEFESLLKTFAGRETPLYFAKNLTEELGGAKIYIKREDLLHGGAHKTNNVIGQALLAREMGAKSLIAETGAGQHGIATAMAGAHFGFPVKIFMGSKDIERQKVNVERMKLLGAEVISVEVGSKSLKDAINEAMRYWISHSEDVYYMFGTAAGPHPFPELVARLQKVIGEEAREQILAA
ncbi:MAG: pyridoxal-phosphate dependent enzyme, partial [Candidatus Peregrinibacteria bacterium]|nr:pyridoxal-phosphate dependent enzyme [Candidatus Peregrinibacteria bacterium]